VWGIWGTGKKGDWGSGSPTEKDSAGTRVNDGRPHVSPKGKKTPGNRHSIAVP